MTRFKLFRWSWLYAVLSSRSRFLQESPQGEARKEAENIGIFSESSRA